MPHSFRCLVEALRIRIRLVKKLEGMNGPQVIHKGKLQLKAVLILLIHMANNAAFCGFPYDSRFFPAYPKRPDGMSVDTRINIFKENFFFTADGQAAVRLDPEP